MSDFDAPAPIEPAAPPVDAVPQGYTGTFTPEQWQSIPMDVRSGIVGREQRAQHNHREQLDRVRGSITDMVKSSVSEAMGDQKQSNGKGDGSADSWGDVDDREFNSLYGEAQRLQAAARADPDDEQAQAAASRVTPELMRQFQREDARRMAQTEVNRILGERDVAQSVKSNQDRVRGSIVSDFGGDDGEAVLHEGHPLREAAEQEYTRLLEKNGGVDAPGLTYAAYQAAAWKVNRGQSNPVVRRDQEVRDYAQSQQRDLTERSTLRRQGDVFGAHRKELKAFYNGEPISNEAMPQHARRILGRMSM